MRKASSLLFVIGSVLLFATAAGTARASTITDNVTFSVPFTNGTYGGGVGPGFSGGATPVAVTGSFTITFDPTQTYTDDTTDVIETGLTGITTDSAFAFDYSPASYVAGGVTFAAGELIVGGVAAGSCCISLSAVGNDFYLQILTFPTTPTFQQFGYSTSGDDYFYTISPSAASVAITPVAAPEPGSLSLLFAGLLGAAGVGLRKRLGRS